MTLNMEALRWNLSQLPALEKAWDFRLMPVLKMVACHPAVVSAVRDAGYRRYGAAEVDEPAFWGEANMVQDTRPVLISLPPLHRADDVVRIFDRSPVDSMEALESLDAAASRLGRSHKVIIMLDLGDMREGVPVAHAKDFFQAAQGRFPHLQLDGLGVTMGCLYGAAPDDIAMKQMADAAAALHAIAGSCPRISLGGSVFWDWWAEHHDEFRRPEGSVVELRIGDPLLLGYDSYHNKDSAGGHFRRDLFKLHATVLEIMERDLQQPRVQTINGQGESVKVKQSGLHRRALLDCGILHTNVLQLSLDIPDAAIVDFSGNYTILDITNCAVPVHAGDTISFTPAYWAVAQSFRNPMVRKHCLPCA